MVAIDGVLGQLRGRVGPFLELLHDPGELTDRRVGQPVGQGLRPGGLDLEVAVHVGFFFGDHLAGFVVANPALPANVSNEPCHNAENIKKWVAVLF